MKNNLKTKIQENNVKFKNDNDNISGIYDYYLSTIEVSNQEKLPPKNSISELIFKNKVSLLKKKIDSENIDLDSRDNVGPTASWTPLYWSVKYRKIECIRLLLEHGANLNIVVNDLDECCGTVLDLAILRGDCEIESILREFANNDETNINITFKAIRTKLRGKSPSFNFNSYAGKNIK